MATAAAPTEVILKALAAYLGPHTARTALRTFCQRAVGKVPDLVTREDAPAVLAAMRPALRTLLGRATSDRVIANIEEEIAA